MLIVLDDAHDAAQVRPLLPGGGGAAVIVTSRTMLSDLPGASFCGLGVLDDAASRALFTAIVGHRRLSAEPESTRGVLTACAGLPLALRIAGSRLASRPGWSVGRLSGLLAGEQRRLGELTTGDLAVRASIEVSYQALPQGGRMFRLFGLAGFAALSAAALAALAVIPEAEASDAAWRPWSTPTCSNHRHQTGSPCTTWSGSSQPNGPRPTRPMRSCGSRCTGCSPGTCTACTPPSPRSASCGAPSRSRRCPTGYGRPTSPMSPRRSHGSRASAPT